MLTIAQVFAILSLLVAFNVEPAVVQNVHDILISTEASTTPVTIVPVVVTPVVENAPVYFGSTNPITPTNSPPSQTSEGTVPTTTAVVSLPPVDTSDPLIVRGVEISPGGYLRIFCNKPVTATVTSGTLDAPLVDNYPTLVQFDQDGKTWTEHVYEFKLTGAKRPFSTSFTDLDGHTYTQAFN